MNRARVGLIAGLGAAAALVVFLVAPSPSKDASESGASSTTRSPSTRTTTAPALDPSTDLPDDRPPPMEILNGPRSGRPQAPSSGGPRTVLIEDEPDDEDTAAPEPPPEDRPKIAVDPADLIERSDLGQAQVMDFLDAHPRPPQVVEDVKELLANGDDARRMIEHELSNGGLNPETARRTLNELQKREDRMLQEFLGDGGFAELQESRGRSE